MSPHLPLLPVLLLVTLLLGLQPCQASVEEEGGLHQQDLGLVHEQKDSEGAHHHGGGHLKDSGGGGGGHGGGADGGRGHSEAGHHAEVSRRNSFLVTSLSGPQDALQSLTLQILLCLTHTYNLSLEAQTADNLSKFCS